MIEVELPDGTIAEFPDTMSPADIQRVLQSQFPAQQQPQAQPAPTQPETVRGAILPFEKNLETGELSWAVPQMGQAVINAARLPGDVMSGEVPIRDSNGQISDEAIRRSMDLAGLISPASRAFAPRGPVQAPAQPPMRPGQQVAQSADRLGVQLPRSVVSDNIVMQQAGRGGANLPVAGVPLRKAAREAIDQMDNVARSIQDDLGTGEIPLAGSAARQNIGSYITNAIKDQIEQKYQAVSDLVNPTVTRPLAATRKMVSEITARRKSAAISKPSPAIGHVQEAIDRPEGLTFEGLKALRTTIREQLDNSLLPADTSKAELKQIYSALTRDLRATAQKGGGSQALKAFDAANSFAARKATEREALNEILKPHSDEGVFGRLVAMASTSSRANVKDLARARKAVSNQTWDEISSAVISRLGRDAEGNFTPDRFVTAYGKLTPEGKRILFGSTGRETVQALDDLARVSSRFKELNQYANPSGTAQNVLQPALGAALYADPINSLVGLVGARTLAGYLAKPVTARQVSNWAKAYQSAATNPTHVTRRVLARRAQSLGLTLARELGVPEFAAQFSSRLNNIAPATADGEQGQGPGTEQVPAQPIPYDPRIQA